MKTVVASWMCRTPLCALCACARAVARLQSLSAPVKSLMELLCAFKAAVQTFPLPVVPPELLDTLTYDPLKDAGAATSSYLRDREGPALMSLVNLSTRLVLPYPIVAAEGSVQRGAPSVTVGDVVVRGGKWCAGAAVVSLNCSAPLFVYHSCCLPAAHFLCACAGTTS